MAKSYNATEYMYSSARIRSMENRIATKERLNHFCDMSDSEKIMAQLSDHGFEVVYDEAGGRANREATLISVLRDGFEEIERMECTSAVAFLRYQYDCNNIKALIKCDARGISADDMLLPLGVVGLEELKRAFFEKDYSAFPQNMAEAIAAAEEAFAATKNPQKIDFIIDNACFADMKAAAQELGVDIASELVCASIDLTNIITVFRIIKMNLGVMTSGIVANAFIPGGSFTLKELSEAAESGEEELCATLARSKYFALAESISSGEPMRAIEKKADDIRMEIAKKIKFVPFGAELAIGYVMALEYEVKNIRIILAGKDAGLSCETIRERLRESYV